MTHDIIDFGGAFTGVKEFMKKHGLWITRFQWSFANKREITNALVVSANGVMFEKKVKVQMIRVAVMIVILKGLYDN